METVLANRYVLETAIAAGAAGTVWRARDTRTGQPVAVKVLRADAATDADVVKAFRDEAEVLSGVDHPGVVRPRDFVATDGELALVMDLVEGTDLRRRVRTEGPLPPTDAVRILADVADALHAVHAAGIVHGDVKPGNILVPHDGAPARLADFGVARRVHSSATPTHGTPEYLAPEVVAGNPPTLASDVYALGIVLYELMSGRSPFRGGPVQEVLRRQQECVAVQPPGMPNQVWQLITRCLEHDPRLRPSAGELAVALRSLRPTLNGMPAAAPLPDDVVTYRPRVAEASETATPVSPAPTPVSATPVSGTPVSATPVSVLPSGAIPVSPAPAGPAAPPAPGSPAPGVDAQGAATAHGMGTPPPAATSPAGAPDPWPSPSDGGENDFLTAVLAAPGAEPTASASPTQRKRGVLVGLVGAAAAVLLLAFLGVLWFASNGGDPTETDQPPAASNEREASPSPSRDPSPSPTPRQSSPQDEDEPRQQQPPPQQEPSQDPGDSDQGDGDNDGDNGNQPSIPPPPTNQMPTLPTKPFFPPG